MFPQKDALCVQALIVDDDPEHAQIYRELIQGPDLDVAVADNGQAALRLLRTRPFQIVLTDLIMPVMDGMELMRRILVEHPAMIVIMITGSSDLRGAVRAMQQGAFSYFSKAGDADELRQEIRKAQEILRLPTRAPSFGLPKDPPSASEAFPAPASPEASLKQVRSMAEAAHIRNVLHHAHGHRAHAARILGITYRHLLNKINVLGI